ITGSGSLVELGTTSLILNPSTPNDYSGGTVLGAGSEFLILSSNNSPLGTGPLTLFGTGSAAGTLQNNPLGRATPANPLVLDNPAPSFNQNATIGGVSPFTFSGPVTLRGLSTVTFNAPTTTITGPISGTGALTKGGTGNLILAGSDTHTGTVVATAGG